MDVNTATVQAAGAKADRRASPPFTRSSAETRTP
jgi:hypothetical protein